MESKILKIKFALNPIDDEVSEYELGDMDILIGDKTITSRNKTPDQSMMIFLSISDMLYGMRILMENKQNSFYFNAIDSSFAIYFARQNEQIKIAYQKDVFIVELLEFASTLYNNAEEFVSIL